MFRVSSSVALERLATSVAGKSVVQVHPLPLVLRMSSSVFRAPCGFGHKEVGGSNPSSSTICGDSIGQVCDAEVSPLQDNATINGRQTKAVRLAVSNLLEAFGRAWFDPTSLAPNLRLCDFTAIQEITLTL